MDDELELDDSLCCTLLSPSVANLTPRWANVCVACVPVDTEASFADLIVRTVQRISEADHIITKNALLWLSLISNSDDPFERDFPHFELMKSLTGWDMRLLIIPAIKAGLVPEWHNHLMPFADGGSLPKLLLLSRGRMPVPKMSDIWWPPHLFLHRFERLPLPLAQRMIHHSAMPNHPISVLNLWPTDGGVIEEICASLEIPSWTIFDKPEEAWAVQSRLAKLNARTKLILDSGTAEKRRARRSHMIGDVSR